jgi:hypothetical protein
LNAKQWKTQIIRRCKLAGTYDKAYTDAIVTLAGVLEQRDRALEQYEEEGSHPVIEHENVSGSVYMERNPLLRVWMDLNAQALAYWRDLGLTPSAFKRITGESGKAKEADRPLAAALKELAKA